VCLCVCVCVVCVCVCVCVCWCVLNGDKRVCELSALNVLSILTRFSLDRSC